MKNIFALLLLAALLTACTSKSMEPTDPAKAIDVGAGDEFTIILESNPTTGYHWEVVEDTLDESLVKFVSREYQSTSEPGLTGGGGIDIWTFKAVGPGAARIVLGYYPPSNTPADPEQMQTFNVNVK
ncbi:MAG: protease inhibitor I42 family protein [Anaerolineales bacterium]